MSWLQDIADQDDVTLEEAAQYVAALGISLGVEDYLDLGPKGRKALVAAHMAAELTDELAAQEEAENAGRAEARRLARLAGLATVRALNEAREGGHGLS